ncbi:MAG: hypothetical protein ABI614_08010 [Planctomycetota bacterium]
MLFARGQAFVEQGFNAGVQRLDIFQQCFLTVVDVVDQSSLGFGRAHTERLAGIAWTAGASGLAFGGRSLSEWLC